MSEWLWLRAAPHQAGAVLLEVPLHLEALQRGALVLLQPLRWDQTFPTAGKELPTLRAVAEEGSSPQHWLCFTKAQEKNPKKKKSQRQEFWLKMKNRCTPHTFIKNKPQTSGICSNACSLYLLSCCRLVTAPTDPAARVGHFQGWEQSLPPLLGMLLPPQRTDPFVGVGVKASAPLSISLLPQAPVTSLPWPCRDSFCHFAAVYLIDVHCFSEAASAMFSLFPSWKFDCWQGTH